MKFMKTLARLKRDLDLFQHSVAEKSKALASLGEESLHQEVIAAASIPTELQVRVFEAKVVLHGAEASLIRCAQQRDAIRDLRAQLQGHRSNLIQTRD